MIRWDTGYDSGFFKVRDKLLKLGFADSDIKTMHYNSNYDVRDPNSLASPTPTNFKREFVDLLRSARPGDVRFLYVDCHGNESPNPAEADGKDEMWRLEPDPKDGGNKWVRDDWIAEALRAHLDPRANLTILTSSCRGGGMLDQNDAARATPGVLLAACAESQANVKFGPDSLDPWTVAVLRKCVDDGGRPVSYRRVYDDAREYIVNKILLAPTWFSIAYLGPSPDPSRPVPLDPGPPVRSHQDPQLQCDGGYMDVDRAEFLEPLP